MKALLLAALASVANAQVIGCYKNTTTRGVGLPISTCDSGNERDGLLCYPNCRAGFDGIGPVCWQQCASPYVDTGAFCQEKIIWGDNKACKSYDLCGLTFDKGCVKCPAGFETHGCLCTSGKTFAKASYGRGAGTPMSCPARLVNDAGLCYPACPGVFQGEGPVCWQPCAAGKFSCGAMCLDNAEDCKDKVETTALDVMTLAFDIATCAMSEGLQCDTGSLEAALKALVKDFALPICPQ